MRSSRLLRPAFLLLAAAAAAALPAPPRAPAAGPPARREPWAGYVFPAGGRRGSSFDVLVGGQNLQNVKDAFVTGEGVRCTVLRAVRPLDRRQQGELRRRIGEIRARRKFPRPDGEKVDLPAHPLLDNLDRLSPRELRDAAERFLGAGGERQQPNPQIAETVEVRVEIDGGAAPGDREFRLSTGVGLTNPIRFQVGVLPEVLEVEPMEGEGTGADSELPAPPLLLNGRILPGDVDRLRFPAKRGQDLVIATAARRLVPFLADAVPGWFQATATLFDGAGREVAFADDWRQDPDPVLLFRVPRDGEYVLEIRDAIYRGREDFVYRVSIGEDPFITRMFPLGGPAGVATMAAVAGWNLPRSHIPLETGDGAGAGDGNAEEGQRLVEARRGSVPSNAVAYAVDLLPECTEREPNDDAARAQPLPLPRIVNGTIGRPGDVDVFRFMGFAGDEVVAEVEARRLGSPVDSLLRLTDAAGTVLAWNDDRPGGGTTGTVTHDADSFLRCRLPADGTYRVVLREAQAHGGDEYGYRLRVGPPRPGFDVFMVPSSLAVGAGRSEAVRMEARRRDGFEGAIDVALTGAPEGWALGGGRIPAGRESVRVTLTAPAKPVIGPVYLRFEARAAAGDGEIRRAVIPAEDVMQAFLWRHLVPSREFAALVAGRGAEPVEVLTDLPVRIAAGKTALVRVRVPARNLPGDLRLVLDAPPAGITLEDVAIVPGMFAFVIRADGVKAKPGLEDNLIIQAALDRDVRGARQRVPVGTLPALPIRVE